ncbi:Vi polysaccharide biosynthesis UDP-N-acetylglucosamine C-6 dehydrogenase TviB [Lentisphaera profundi]|uniref:Vi polysaccharide biosynthesis UDP-N-acetylglucosamine C-6 dehydrogenase TviB n=1 Tax=Lentisphaera profundi TaxID=1658616 RepID=A0ABY7VNJ4_9BACT|nr:Vi polysaccharide biosynthesis UDP-N-acetylglucosamine C-6 dehydrogenase TviB [Lentisphaera profundi]WDE95326.1 Vi polysaccharide biosynthesis UDP-N-acetylglucosamine C-6 dehydrogenase TviB [Lentisphaera profundi]
MKIAIIGLGYVGLPLAVEFGKKVETIGFDINQGRISALNKGHDSTFEVENEEFKEAEKVSFTSEINDLKGCDFYIVTVPTPIDRAKKPDLGPLMSASKTVGQVIEKGAVVIYESTVYPGASEEVCIPIVEDVSGLKFNKDFFAGYSPERINPGDKKHRLPNILKITSGSTPEIADKVDDLYKMIIVAGTHKASSIKVAEAAKVIENTQRDVNIALVNELSLIFNRIGIDTLEVLEAAGTKWNFLPFRPGLVGGHCISVDPYYLTHKAQELGYHPEIILAGRRLNDNMANFVAQEVVKLMIKKAHAVCNAKVLVLGITFKENCPDVRNSGAVQVYHELAEFGCNVVVYDPWANKDEVKHEYGFDLVEQLENDYDAVVLTVGHDEFKELDLNTITHDTSVIYDIKYALDKKQVDGRL